MWPYQVPGNSGSGSNDAGSRANVRVYYPSYDAYFGWQGDNNSASTSTSRDHDPRQNQNVQQVQVSWRDDSRALPAPSSPSNALSGRTPNQLPMEPASQSQPQPVTMYLLPPQQNREPLQNPEPLQFKGQDKPENPANLNPPPRFFPLPPPPTMYPIPPHPMAPPQPHPMFPQPAPAPAQFHSQPPMHPGPFGAAHPPAVVHGAMPPGTFPGRSQPQGPQGLPLIPTTAPSDMRYRCEACGRYRSTKYHYRHPIPPGQLPAKTICRKCRDRATDSEDYTGTSESSPSSGSKYRDSRRSKQRNRSRNGRKARRSVSRVHSMRRGKTPDRHSSRYEESSATYSDSSELERRHPSGKYRQRQHSHASSGRERRRLRLSPCEERIYYEGRSVGRKHLDIPEDFEDDDYDYENPRGVRISSRAQSRTRRVVRRQDSDAYSGNPPQAEYYVERYEYIQQPPSRHHQRGYSPQQGPALPNVRDTSLPAHNRSQHPQQEDKDTHDQGAYDRLRSRSIPRGRLRSRENDFHYGDPSQGRHGRRLVYAPSPPPARSSSLGYLADPEAEEKEQQHIRIGGSRRRRSRSRPLDVESSELRILRPGDELTVVERYAPRPNQDYERYDHEGIRVRVREI